MVMHLTGYKINRHTFSISYMFAACAISIAVFTVFYSVQNFWSSRIRKLCMPLVWLGRNPLIVFAVGVCGVLEHIFQAVYWKDVTCNNLVHVYRVTFLTNTVCDHIDDCGVSLFIVTKVVFWVCACGVLFRKDIIWKL
eukprot:c15359_g1_i1.p1 GENE.c15359_g1_i1~~c15359_g1_i1.p1  ORF type:complete len:138 (+),score=25.70 c15359_g1_i1:1-414(+)